MPDCLTEALALLGRGWSVLPLCPPDHVGVGRDHRGCSSPGKRPFFPTRANGSGDWKRYQTERATAGDVRGWWATHPRLNLGVALGPVSGICAVDVDDEEGETLLQSLSAGDLPPTLQYTTGKGRRLIYALPEGREVVNHSFRRPGTEIEILRFMSRGGQVVLPPSLHPNGSTYRWCEGCGPDDREPAPAPDWLRAPRPNEGAAWRPADGELITEGGRNNYLTSLAGAMRKRGADEEVILAALGVCNRNRCDPSLREEELQTIARSVCRYAPDEWTGVTIKPHPPGRVPDPPAPGDYARKFKWSSELAAPPKSDDWLWEGYLPRAAVALISALWKAGKTTLLGHLLRAFAAGGEFLGQPIRPSKVLFISEEGEKHWVRRRDALGLGDHAGFYFQPFAAKPQPADWLTFVGQLRADVQTHGFDLVIFDTLAKLWPVREENDAGAVDDSLMPLWELTKAGAGILLMHHLRKSGGGEYTASRGSGALSAFPDVVIELVRFTPGDQKCPKRILRAKGRYDETPDELVIELRDGHYVLLDEEATGKRLKVNKAGSEEDRLLAVLEENPDPWMQIDEIRAALTARKWGMRDKNVRSLLTSLLNRSLVLSKGVFRSSVDPLRYALSERISVRPTPSAPGAQTGRRCDDDPENTPVDDDVLPFE